MGFYLNKNEHRSFWRLTMKIRKNYLLLLASLVWVIAGANIFHIGIELYGPYLGILNISLSIIIYIIFQFFIFGKLVKKHTIRICSYEEEYQQFYKFFDKPSFIIMVVMMTGGILLRTSGIAPERFISVFYSGLGFALLMAGILFGFGFIKMTFKKVTE